jgi:glycine cleavage system aminomethyltransferase T
MAVITTLVSRSPLDAWHAAHGARFREINGWQVVAAYADREREAAVAREHLALVDVSASGKLSVRLGAAVAVERLPSSIRELRPLQAAWVDGDLTCRLTEDAWLLLSLAPGGSLPQWNLNDWPVVAVDVTSAYAGFMLVGTPLENVLRRLTHFDIRPSRLPVGACAETQIAGVEALLVPSPELSLPAMRIYVAWDVAEYVWERIIAAGPDFRIALVGWEAIELLRSM